MRWFITALLTAGLVVGAGWYFDYFTDKPDLIRKGQDSRAGAKAKPQSELGDFLYKPAELKAIKWPDDAKERFVRPIILDEANLKPIDIQDVPSYKEGIILIIGEEVKDPSKYPPALLQTVRIIEGDKTSFKTYRRWKEGDVVTEGQTLAWVDPSLAFSDVKISEEKVKTARLDHQTTEATLAEAKNRLETDEDLYRKKVLAFQELRGSRLTERKYFHEEAAKRSQIAGAVEESNKAKTILRQHEIHSSIPGNAIIKTILKQPGEGIKPLDTVMQVYGISRLRAEGFLDAQYLPYLNKGLKVIVEPSQEMPPEQIKPGHRAEITAVAISYDKLNPTNPRFVSASEDGRVMVWQRIEKKQPVELRHGHPVTAVACSPRGSARNLCVAGCSDGSVHIWDLDNPETEITHVPAHREAVTAIAFGPKGEYFATGGQDNTINLWKTDEGKILYPFDAEHGVGNPHQGAITALHFTADTKLISASRDNTLRVWTLREKGAHLAYDPITGRSGTVAKLGASEDGQLMLLDKGKDLQVLDAATGNYICSLQNNPNAPAHETLALVSPDRSLLLTAGAPEGRLQLWRTPSNPNERGYELRQLVTNERSPVTCAAFSPKFDGVDEAFAISGTKEGKVYVWALPTKQEMEAHRITKNAKGEDLVLTMVDRQLEAGKIRVGVDIDNPESAQYPQGRLVPGRRVRLVIQPR